jgi:hypothetical protein
LASTPGAWPWNTTWSWCGEAHYGTELVADGDEVEIVNFVGGG